MSSETYHTYEVLGRKIRIRDTLADFLLIKEELADEDLDDETRFKLLMLMLFPNPQAVVEAFTEQLEEMLDIVLFEAFGIDLLNTRRHEKEILNFDEDKDRMIVTARSAYNLSWDELCSLSYKESMLLMGMAPRETPMGQALYYRTAKTPKRTKYNADEIKAFREARRFYALGKKERKTDESGAVANAAADADFAALERKIAHG